MSKTSATGREESHSFQHLISLLQFFILNIFIFQLPDQAGQLGWLHCFHTDLSWIRGQCISNRNLWKI